MHVLWSSVSSSETSSAATFTQSPLRLDASRACHCNAGTRPRSSSMEGRNSSAMLRTTPIDSSTNRCYRQQQVKSWMYELIEQALRDEFLQHAGVREKLASYE